MESVTGNRLKLIRILAEQADNEQLYDLKEHRMHRSLTQNSYYWVLIGKLAGKLNISNAELHNRMLRDFGQYDRINDCLVTVPLPDTDETEETVLQSETYHLAPTSQVMMGAKGIMYRTYVMLKGSRDYNTEEMTRLLDGLINECHEQGIETLPPDEIAHMRAVETAREAKKNEVDHKQ